MVKRAIYTDFTLLRWSSELSDHPAHERLLTLRAWVTCTRCDDGFKILTGSSPLFNWEPSAARMSAGSEYTTSRGSCQRTRLASELVVLPLSLEDLRMRSGALPSRAGAELERALRRRWGAADSSEGAEWAAACLGAAAEVLARACRADGTGRDRGDSGFLAPAGDVGRSERKKTMNNAMPCVNASDMASAVFGLVWGGWKFGTFLRGPPRHFTLGPSFRPA